MTVTMNQRESYRGYEIGWQQPPATSAGYDMSIASSDATLQGMLEEWSGAKGAYTFRQSGLLHHAVAEARKSIDAVLAKCSS